MASSVRPRDAIVTIAWCQNAQMLHQWQNDARPAARSKRQEIEPVHRVEHAVYIDRYVHHMPNPCTAAFSTGAGCPPRMTCHSRVVGFPLAMIVLTCRDNVLNRLPALRCRIGPGRGEVSQLVEDRLTEGHWRRAGSPGTSKRPIRAVAGPPSGAHGESA